MGGQSGGVTKVCRRTWLFIAANYSATCMLLQCRKYLLPQQVSSKRDGLLHIRPPGELEEDIFQTTDIALHQLPQLFFGP
jgi:hypothetical protein